jgi:hypothetical protein
MCRVELSAAAAVPEHFSSMQVLRRLFLSSAARNLVCLFLIAKSNSTFTN